MTPAAPSAASGFLSLLRQWWRTRRAPAPPDAERDQIAAEQEMLRLQLLALEARVQGRDLL